MAKETVHPEYIRLAGFDVFVNLGTRHSVPVARMRVLQ